MSRGMGGHQSARAGKDEWLTPPRILDLLGPFDLDPCAPIQRPWPMAVHHYTIEDNGLAKPWFGRVWCNPPYGRETDRWLARCVEHGNAIALVFARTETEMFFEREEAYVAIARARINAVMSRGRAECVVEEFAPVVEAPRQGVLFA